MLDKLELNSGTDLKKAVIDAIKSSVQDREESGSSGKLFDSCDTQDGRSFNPTKVIKEVEECDNNPEKIFKVIWDSGMSVTDKQKCTAIMYKNEDAYKTIDTFIHEVSKKILDAVEVELEDIRQTFAKVFTLEKISQIGNSGLVETVATDLAEILAAS